MKHDACLWPFFPEECAAFVRAAEAASHASRGPRNGASTALLSPDASVSLDTPQAQHDADTCLVGPLSAVAASLQAAVACVPSPTEPVSSPEDLEAAATAAARLVAACERAVEDAKAYEAAVAEQRGAADGARQEAGELETSLSAARARVTALEADVAEQSAAGEELRASLAARQVSLEELQQELAAAGAAAGAAKERSTELEAELGAKAVLLNEAEQRARAAEEEAAAQRAAGAALEAQGAALEAARAELQAALDAADAEVTRLGMGEVEPRHG